MSKVKIYVTDILWPGMRKHKWVLAMTVSFILVFNYFFTIGINVTESLPHKVFLVMDGEVQNIQRGDYVAYRWHGGGPYPAGLTFVKIVAGVPGDKVEERERTFFVNGEAYGVAKEYSKTGEPLDKGATGIISPAHYYVYTPSKDSLDSRYALSGWIPHKNLQGRVIPLF